MSSCLSRLPAKQLAARGLHDLDEPCVLITFRFIDHTKVKIDPDRTTVPYAVRREWWIHVPEWLRQACGDNSIRLELQGNEQRVAGAGEVSDMLLEEVRWRLMPHMLRYRDQLTGIVHRLPPLELLRTDLERYCQERVRIERANGTDRMFRYEPLMHALYDTTNLDSPMQLACYALAHELESENNQHFLVPVSVPGSRENLDDQWDLTAELLAPVVVDVTKEVVANVLPIVAHKGRIDA